MDKLLPRHTLFIIEYGERVDMLMNHKEVSVVKGEQKWTCGTSEIQKDVQLDNLSLTIDDQSMDSVYSSLLSQISGLSISNETEYKEQTELRKKIELLQKQVRAEKQFNRQLELNAEARQLKKEIVDLQRILNK